MTLVRRSGNSHSRDRIAKIVHLKRPNTRAAPYFKYIELEANWAKSDNAEFELERWCDEWIPAALKALVKHSSGNPVRAERSQ